jgi:hypothetical protein
VYGKQGPTRCSSISSHLPEFFLQYFHINFAKIYGLNFFLQNYTSGAVKDGGRDYIDYLTIKMTSNGKTLNYKVVDHVESYNFHIKFTCIKLKKL